MNEAPSQPASHANGDGSGRVRHFKVSSFPAPATFPSPVGVAINGETQFATLRCREPVLADFRRLDGMRIPVRLVMVLVCTPLLAEGQPLTNHVDTGLIAAFADDFLPVEMASSSPSTGI